MCDFVLITKYMSGKEHPPASPHRKTQLRSSVAIDISAGMIYGNLDTRNLLMDTEGMIYGPLSGQLHVGFVTYEIDRYVLLRVCSMGSSHRRGPS